MIHHLKLSNHHLPLLYKATLILDSSVLEAFFIDWIGEIYHQNYCSNNFIVNDQWNPGRKSIPHMDYPTSCRAAIVSFPLVMLSRKGNRYSVIVRP